MENYTYMLVLGFEPQCKLYDFSLFPSTMKNAMVLSLLSIPLMRPEWRNLIRLLVSVHIYIIFGVLYVRTVNHPPCCFLCLCHFRSLADSIFKSKVTKLIIYFCRQSSSRSSVTRNSFANSCEQARSRGLSKNSLY